MDWKADWIWIDEEARPINAHVCFRHTFEWDRKSIASAELRISADTCFKLWVNGTEAGEGPIRSTSNHWYYEQYAVAQLLRQGVNTIAVSVWHYGHSNYQYVENRAGLIVQLDITDSEGHNSVYATDEGWKAYKHEGYERNVVKRNVNIGWLEVYDARRWTEKWTDGNYDDAHWEQAVPLCRGGEGVWSELHPRVIEPFGKRIVYPGQLLSHSEVKPLQKVVSVNMREQFFPGNRDASAKIFTGYFATVIVAKQDARGCLQFAHSPWNGLQGRFKINDKWHMPGDELLLKKGEHMLLVELGGVYNDVISHMEWDFDMELSFKHPFSSLPEEGASPFVTLGPFQVIEVIADGYEPVYGGVEKRSGLHKELPAFLEAGSVNSVQMLQRYREEAKTVPATSVMDNMMIYSLMLRKRVLAAYAIHREQERMLYSHAYPTIIPVPELGGDREYVIDFGKLYVGQVMLELEADAGTVLDIYGFEAIVDGRIRYTSGLNNAFRYTARDGRQSYKSLSRMGFRYLMIAVRRQIGPLSLYRIAVEQSGYPVTNQAVFRCSDPLLNDIWEICRHTSEVCTEDTFVDCPTYERVFWVGDCRVSALVNYYLFGSYELVKHCLEMVPRSQDQSRLLLSCLPTDWQSVIPMWTFSWMIACKDYFAYSGDAGFRQAVYPEFARVLEAYCEFLNDDDLFDISSWNLIDWADMDIPAVGVGTAQHGVLAYCCGIAAELAEGLGYTEEARKWSGLMERMRKALGEHLWDAEQEAFVDGRYRSGEYSSTFSQQTHVLLYLFEALSEEQRSCVEERIVHPPKEWVPISSPFMSFYLFEAWHNMGRLDCILERIRNVWGGMVRQGSTTAWETYPATRSFAHAWSAAPAYVTGKYLLGVERIEDGFKAIRVKPPETELSWAEGAIPTPLGRIDVCWSKEGMQRVMRISVPEAIEVDDAAAHEAGWEVTIDRLR
ncbi:glycoside hydrolase family 78 protein [Paenibacillus sp. J5C_2022]|uniref:glycoside hydrolase family 78 protein n=1 Tax=Paenibacillus sp. J5C2022 TaxID=2977129 RepID=UPI0021CE23E0|nr:glycoside hydrolase family 78 protein [Paenibacillus sp. J5C2022]MCU6707841.1 glycoside hydrolase family 78 protein [Paenibacillus sp. J5C2022]